MLTKDVLSQAVVTAIREARPDIENVEKLVADLEGLEFSQMTEQEQGLVKIARALKESLPIINIYTAVMAGGFGTDNLPRLALATYTNSLVQGSVEVVVAVENGLMSFNGAEIAFWGCKLPGQGVHRGKIGIPLVPPSLRVKDSEGVLLLFEVEKWEPVPERNYYRDPYLLRHIAGWVYSVLGTWDISENELKAYQAARNLGI